MKTIMALQDVHFRADQQEILQGITMNVATGENITITGPSGSGKSTLLKIMATLINKTSGTFLYEDKPIETYSPIDYRREVSYCFQQAGLFGKSVRDNLKFPYDIRQLPFDEARALDSLADVGLPKNYLDKVIITLSGGEKQRVALIRNLQFKPKVLLLDEITAGLDAENQEIVLAFVQKYAAQSDLTTIAVTHNESEIKRADHLFTVNAGLLEVDR